MEVWNKVIMDVVGYIKNVKGESSVGGDFKATAIIDVVDNDSRDVKTMSVILSLDEFITAVNVMGKILYINIEVVDEEIMAWFDIKSPFEDTWREEILETHIERLTVVESSG